MNDETDVLNSVPYNVGINQDSFSVWRNDGDIGYVHFCFRIIVEACYDLICGTHDDILSASVFFYGIMYEPEKIKPKTQDEEGYGKEDEPVDYSTGSLYRLYAQILGYTSLPEIVVKHRNGRVTTKDVENLRSLYTVMATI